MALSVGIVGLPNVGKSTLFNAVTNAGIAAENYPFCTIEPNTGIVEVPDQRLQRLAEISGSEKCIPTTITFTDIAGLVKGASEGEGLGNQFLGHIREVSAIVHVLRCFEDNNISHVDGSVDAIRDIDVIETELILSDLEMAERLLQRQGKEAKAGDKEAIAKRDLFEKIHGGLAAGKAVRALGLSDTESALLKGIHFISAKPMLYVANVAEHELPDGNAESARVAAHAANEGYEMIVLSAAIEEELQGLDLAERQDYLESLGLSDSGLDRLSQACFKLLGLQSYLTTGPKESRAWTVPVGATAPEAAGVIHSDFEDGFIRANVIHYDEFISCGGFKVAKEKGALRQEGRDYVMQDGDVVEFLFNV